MAVNKFSISLPETLLADVDELARVDNLTRSAVIREGMAAYVAGRTSARREQERRKLVDDALAELDVIAQDWGADERSGLDYLREIRGESEAAGAASPEPDDPHGA